MNGDESGHAFFHCDACDAIYLFPRLTEEETQRLYTKGFEEFMAKRSGDDTGYWLEAERHIASNEDQRLRRMKYLEPHLPKPSGRILEIGCSSGFMLYPLQERGFECDGVEPSHKFLKVLVDKGLPSFGSLKDLKSAKSPQDKYDLIMHFFVLEHVEDPVGFLSEQLTMLNPGGKLVVEAPCCDDALVTVYAIDEFENFYWTIVHQWYFSAVAFRFLMEEIGVEYEILLDQRYDLSNHMIWARDGKPGGTKRFTDTLGPEIEEAYKRALVEAKKCDTIIGILKAPE